MSTHEMAIVTVLGFLQVHLPDITIKRNVTLPTAIPDNGLIIVRDGDMGEPSTILSPLRYAYYHHIAIEVIVQQSDGESIDTKLDDLLMRIGEAMQKPFQPDDGISCYRTGNIELTTEPVEGGRTMKMAQFPVIVEYVTSNPLKLVTIIKKWFLLCNKTDISVVNLNLKG